MEVIFRGTPKSEQIYKGLCNSCKSVLQYKFSEILKNEHHQRDGVTHYLEEPCPVCSSVLVIFGPTLQE